MVYEQGCYSYVPVPEGVDLEAYKDQTSERFFQTRRSAIRYHGFAAMALPSFAVYVVPILKQMLQDGKDIR